MVIGEIAFLVSCALIVFGTIICLIGFEILSKKYEKFYKTTELGKELLDALRSISLVEKETELYNEVLKATAAQIDEINSYYPNETYYAEKVNNLKQKYLEAKKKLKQSEEHSAICSIKLDELKKQLPKKYKNVLNYNWQRIEGEKNEN